MWFSLSLNGFRCVFDFFCGYATFMGDGFGLVAWVLYFWFTFEAFVLAFGGIGVGVSLILLVFLGFGTGGVIVAGSIHLKCLGFGRVVGCLQML